uniref:Tetratricopeptide repeat-containing protein n=1 Tax=Candidatus Kentrum eta TaxID=2126337 RepID=A0A450VB29_9GAMM|nr:MAG: hypothetical protein BECKH772A_GA0070896_1008110 [Candidatus Kentron sp. H]VFJ95784.1 MAG: hypothetical protein BECKH772B_GA0070898_1008110 [Candidatus Kentron sp. H]VFK01979.1 MAG: hypothetical protein BECKH772C_GA0070978_1007810 [Candidatus Kentron sp. H]
MVRKPAPHAMDKSLDNRQCPIDFPEDHNRRNVRCAARADAIIKVTPPSTDIFNIGRSSSSTTVLLANHPRKYLSTRKSPEIPSRRRFDFMNTMRISLEEDPEKGEIRIELEKKGDKEEFEKRVPRWLGYRRRDPNNPVLMRAISQYLNGISDYDEAIEEVHELLKVAPDWFIAHNRAGYIKLIMRLGDEA